MKKNVCRILAAMLVLVMLLGLAACKSKKDDSSSKDGGSVAGTYRLTTVNGDDLETAFRKQADEQGYTLDQLFEMFNQLAAMAGSDMKLSLDTLRDYAIVTLKEDGTVTVSSLGATANGTWEQNGDSINVKVTMDGEESQQTYKFEGGKLIQADEEDTLIYEKD